MNRSIAILLILLISSPVFADIDATLRNGIGARSAAMGLAQVAVAEGAESIYWNPAALAKITGYQISTSANEIYGTSYKAFGLAGLGWGGGWGMLVMAADQGGIPETTLDPSGRPIVIGSFGYDAKAVYLSYAREFGRSSIGANLKYLNEGLYGKSVNGLGADLGVLVKPSRILSFGAKIENAVAPQMKWNTDSGNTDVMQTNYKIGAAVKPEIQPLLLTGDIGFIQGGSPAVYLGAEYEPVKNVFIRGGVFSERLSLGIGIQYHNLKVDYSYARGNDYLDDSHRISLNLLFADFSRILAEKNKPATLETSVAGTKQASKEAVTFISQPVMPGEMLYMKVLVSNIKAERVSVVYKESKVPLFSNDLVTWKGSMRISTYNEAGENKAAVYVADVNGHLIKSEAIFTVIPLPERRIVFKRSQPKANFALLRPKSR
ncbi:MAG: hypothetical protein PHH60_00355 [Candidatus Margulisbacteria bacterium]|nr:hypothetical protein [Candidatus Margulisiibacteriota bacterium]